MTREEAKSRAKAMPRIKALVDFRNNVIDFCFPYGQCTCCSFDRICGKLIW